MHYGAQDMKRGKEGDMCDFILLECILKDWLSLSRNEPKAGGTAKCLGLHETSCKAARD
jgi:hypothetical protein